MVNLSVLCLALQALRVGAFQGPSYDFEQGQSPLTGKQQQQHELPVADKRPNIVFVLTDDQDLHLQSLDYMPLVKKHLRDKGTFYKRHFCTIAVCCPSRVSLWTGQAAHNTNVTDVNPPYGTSLL
jgi:hypothetical protein